MSNFIKIIAFLLLLITNLNGQVGTVKCHLEFNKLDSFFLAKDTVGLVEYSEEIANCDEYMTIYRHLDLAKFYKSQNKLKAAKNEIVKAIEKGLLSSRLSIKHLKSDYDKIENIGGSDFLAQMILKDRKLLSEMDTSTKEIRKVLLSINKKDQKLRGNKEYKKCRNHHFQFMNKYGQVDTLENHESLMECALEFRQKDSLVLLEFVNLIDSLGYVPASKDLFFWDIDALMCHTSHFEFEVDLKSIYLHSVMEGFISPKYYAWYLGYNEEYYLKEPSYYYTHSEHTLEEVKLDDIKYNQINSLRKTIGLPNLPISLWSNTGGMK